MGHEVRQSAIQRSKPRDAREPRSSLARSPKADRSAVGGSGSKSDPLQDPDPAEQRTGQGRWTDLTASLSFVAFGATLVIFGHQSPSEVAACGGVVTSMYASWRHQRR